MHRTPRAILAATLVILPVVLGACGDDDPARPGGSTDTTPPRVAGTEPAGGDAGVDQAAPVVIRFNEAMDTGTGVGQVTLSSGTLSSLAWTDEWTLVASHLPWDAGDHVTVTLGTGVTDAAGNALAAPHVFDFHVFTTELEVYGTQPAGGAVDVNRSAMIRVQFSTDIVDASLGANTTISSVGKVDHPFSVYVDGTLATLDPYIDLPGATEITVSIGPDVASPWETTLGAPYVFVFTTGQEVDTTPPTVVSSSPSTGTVFAADVGEFTVTFSEPMDPFTFAPTAWNAEFAKLLLHTSPTPTWSTDGTVVSVVLPSPLPAGLPVEVTFADLADGNGLTVATPWVWAARVAGAPDYYPAGDRDDYVFALDHWSGPLGSETPDSHGSGTRYERFEAQGGGIVRLVEYVDAFTTPSGDYEIYRRLSDRLEWLGFRDSGSPEVLFAAPLNVLPLPPAVGSWNDATSVTIAGEGTYTADLSGSIVGPDDMPLPDAGSATIFFKDVYQVVRTLDVQLDGTPYQVRRDTLWISPTLGRVRAQGVDRQLDQDRWEREVLWRTIDDD